jgi:two-component system response regulator RegX3
MEETSPEIECSLFESGADDVVVLAHTSALALAKRIHAHLRDVRPSAENVRCIRLDHVVVDFENRTVCRDGVYGRLPGILSDLLKYFVQNYGRLISREELESSHIWADSVCTSARDGGKTIDVNMGKLRRIVERDAKQPKIIATIRGIGWRLDVAPICVLPPSSARMEPCGRSGTD